MRTVFPTEPCTNIDCDWSISCSEYMNCSHVASESGEHSLQLIGDMLGLSREGVRLIEKRALMKLRANHESIPESVSPAGENYLGSPHKITQLPPSDDLLSTVGGGDLDE